MLDFLRDFLGLNNVDFFAESSSTAGSASGMNMRNESAGGSDISKNLQSNIPSIRKEVSVEGFEKVNTRIKRSTGIANDLKPGDGSRPFQGRIDELRDIEKRSKRGDEAKKSGLEEIVFDTRGYLPARTKVEYVDSNNRSVSEEVVSFGKRRPDGSTEYLTFSDGKAVAVNASLYDVRLSSGKYAQSKGAEVKMMPRINERGAYSGVMTFIEDNASFKPQSLQEVAGGKSNERVFNAVQIKQELERPIVMKDLPAIDVLARQFDKSYADLLKKAPNMPRQQVAFNLAQRFFKVGLYQRIAEQSMFGPEKYERYDSPEQLAGVFPQIKSGINAAEKQIAAARPSTRVFHENGWLYVDQGRHKTDYRIYLSPDPRAIGKVFSELALTMPDTVGYQMKTFSSPTDPVEVSRLDKIIMYCPDGDFQSILDVVGKVYKNNSAAFKDRPAPGGGIVSPIDGVSIIKQPENTPSGQQVTGTEFIEKKIKEVMTKRVVETAKNRMRAHGNIHKASTSIEGSYFWSGLNVNHDSVSRVWYAGDTPLNDQQKSALTSSYFRSLWVAGLGNMSEGTPITSASVRQNFIKYLKEGSVQFSPSQQKYLLSGGMAQFGAESIQEKISGAVKKTGLSIVLGESLAKGQNPGAAFRALLSN